MITVGGRTLPESEERIVRSELIDGHHVPLPFACDGCSGGCPDTWPPGLPPEQRIPIYLACVVHDASPPYDEHSYGFWKRAWLRLRADVTLVLNWWMVGELYAERMTEWSWFHKRTWGASMVLLYVGLRWGGWVAYWRSR
jgi:hypothetical protein